MDNNIINDIRKSIDIIDVISKYIPLTSKGKNYFGVCPFHDDHSPSMSVSKEKQIYKCFSCGATGNVFNFIMDYENVSFKEALQILSGITGISIHGIDVKDNKPKNNELYDIYDVSSKFYINNLNTSYGINAKEYLHSRAIDDNLIKEFQIGLSLSTKDLLTKVLVNKGFSNKDLVDSGLVFKTDYGYMDMYVNRIMFPLYDTSGRIVGYSGRIYNRDDSSKYINTRETKIFKKGELLYNYHRAKESCRKKNQVIITEGFMDVIRCYSIGITNVVAAMGTAITKEHILLIRKLARDVILCFDGDSAGAKATESCINMLLENKIIPKIVRLEDNLDPDEYVKKYGKDRFISKLDNPISVMDFKLSYLKNNKDMNSSQDLANYVNSVISELDKIDDDILREVTLKKVSEESNLDIDLLRSKLTKKEEQTVVLPKKNVISTKYEKAQMYLLYYMLQSVEVVKIYDEHVVHMPNDDYRRLAYYISCFYNENDDVHMADLMTYLSMYDNVMVTVKMITDLDLKDDYTKDEIYDYIYTIREFSIKGEIKKLKDLQRVEVDNKKKNEITERIIELKRMGQERYYD